MTTVDHQTLAQLMARIASDLETATALASAAAASANNDATAGRINAAFERILIAEPQIFQANKLISVATYVAELDNSATADRS